MTATFNIDFSSAKHTGKNPPLRGITQVPHSLENGEVVWHSFPIWVISR